MSRRFAVALVHYPVLDAQKALVTTAITNLDIHDIARSARTYGASDYFLVHPITAQRELVEKICEHWRSGSSGRRIPDRKIALELVRTVPSLEATYEALGGRDKVELWVTAARNVAPPITTTEARARLGNDDPRTVLILLGTGWGLAPEVVEQADFVVEPLRADEHASYNHLSVRAACAILLDRLRGAR